MRKVLTTAFCGLFITLLIGSVYYRGFIAGCAVSLNTDERNPICHILYKENRDK